MPTAFCFIGGPVFESGHNRRKVIISASQIDKCSLNKGNIRPGFWELLRHILHEFMGRSYGPFCFIKNRMSSMTYTRLSTSK